MPYSKRKPPAVGVIERRNAPPPRTPEEQEQRMIGLAMEAAQKQLEEGTASSQVITHFLKLGTVREQIELEKVKKEIALLDAKKKAIESAEEVEKKYAEVIAAITRYTGKDSDWETVDDDYGD